MKKVVLALSLVVLAVAAGLCWLSFPWSSVIEARVASVGPDKMVSEFDAWTVSRKRNETHIDVATLPPSLRALKPVRALRRPDGLYLVMKQLFVEDDGVFIASPGIHPPVGLGSDPSFVPLGTRVFRYHISG